MSATLTDHQLTHSTTDACEWADYLDQRTASQFLRSVCGVTIAAKTLQKRRVIGGGPPFRKVIGRVVYERAPLKAWGEAQRSAPVTSTSELF